MNYWFHEQMIRRWYQKQEDEKLSNEMKTFMLEVADVINKTIEDKKIIRTNKS